VHKAKVGTLALFVLLSLSAVAHAQVTNTQPVSPSASPVAAQKPVGAQIAPPARPAPPKAPLITSDSTATFIVGKDSLFTVTATGSPKPTFTPRTLPQNLTLLGLKFDPTTGKLTGIPQQTGTYTINFGAANGVPLASSQTFKLTVQPSTDPACDAGGDLIRMRTLKDADADGLSTALNSAFDQLSIFAVAQTADKSSTEPSPPGQGQPSKPASPPRQWLCVIRREPDPNTGSLKPGDASTSSSYNELKRVIVVLDRPEFAGISLDSRFLVHFAHVKNRVGHLDNPLAALVSALPTPAPGLELNADDLVGQYLVIHPASTELQLALKAGSDLATQAARVKHDLLALDAQSGYVESDKSSAWSLLKALRAVSSESSTRPEARRVLMQLEQEALVELEVWDTKHTVPFTVLNCRLVAVRVCPIIFPNWSVAVLTKQNAITLRPPEIAPDAQNRIERRAAGLLATSDLLERNAIYDQIQAMQAWEQKLQTDGASNPNGSGNGAAQSPVTTTISNTTIAMPAATSPDSSADLAMPKKTPPPIQVQTTTTAQTSPPTGVQGVSSSAAAPQASANSTSPVVSNSTTGANAGGGAGGNSGGGTSSPAQIQAQTPQPPPPSGRVVRLFHLRQAANIATVINAIVTGTANSPLVQPLSDSGNDDLLLILPPVKGQPDRTESIRRMIASLDEPRPAISMQVWSYEISSDKGAKYNDREEMTKQAGNVAKATVSFTHAVEIANDRITRVMMTGMALATNYAANKEDEHRGSFFDPDFSTYLTGKFEDCIKNDQYCLGYDTALSIGKPGSDTETRVSLGKFALLVAATRDEQAGGLIEHVIEGMEEQACQDSPSDSPPLHFVHLKAALKALAQPRTLHQFRAALLDFLFQYKWAIAYPNDFGPYELQSSAQNLDGFLNDLITPLNLDLDRYITAKLQSAADALTNDSKKVGIANYGEVQVNTISGGAAAVSATVNNYFDITKPALLQDLLSALPGAGGSTQSSTSTSSTSSVTPAALLTPWEMVALKALAAAAAPPQLVAQVNAQTSLTVTPISLDTAAAAELDISLQLSQPTSTIDASKGTSSSFIRQDLANSVASYTVKTQVRVDSLKLFPISSLSIDLTHAQTSVPVPIIGWAYEAIFGTVPWMKDHILAIPRAPETVQNRAVAVVRAVIAPTAMDLGLSMPFRDDSVGDPISLSSKSFSSEGQTNNKLEEFHKQLIVCVLKGNAHCMDKIRLGDIEEQSY
jgi:hypothetical protein